VRRDDRQAMPVELRHERRLIVQPVQMHAVQIEHDIAVRIPLWRKVNVAEMTGDGFGAPRSRFQVSSFKLEMQARGPSQRETWNLELETMP